MNLFVAISDVHISQKNLDVSVATLTQALNRARDLRVPLLIAGDLNDGKAIMRSEWVRALIDLFTLYSDVHIHILVGNHDLDNKNASGNSLYFLTVLDNVTLYDKTVTTFINLQSHGLWGIIPYMPQQEEFKKELSFMKTNDVKRLIIHQGILGAYMGDYVVDESSVPPEAFEGFEIVLSGHYHRAQKVGDNIQYFGSPFTVNFGEANETKFIWIVEEVEGKINLKPELTEARRHYQIEFSQKDVAMEKPAIPAGSLLKVVVKGTKEFAREYDLTFFKEQFPQAASISIVPEIDKQHENRISADIINSPLLVVESYLQNCVTTHDKNLLKDYLLRLCQDVFSKHTSSVSKNFKIIGFELENFGSFRSLKYKYEPMGLTLVEGFDEDLGVNTGAGKSTFLDAPVYGLFGETSKSLKADEVINRQAGKNLTVVTHLQGDDGIYSVVRYRKHHDHENDLYLLLPNGQQLRGKDNRETQKLIEQTLGCSFEVFLKSSYFTQFGNIDRFLSASDTEKKKLISEITDLSIYDEMLELVKKKVSSDEKDLNYQRFDADKIRSNLRLLEEQQESARVSSSKWALDRAATAIILERQATEFEMKKQQELIAAESKINEWLEVQGIRIRNLEDQLKEFDEQVSAKKSSLSNQIHINNGHISGLEFQIEELKAFPVIVDVVAEKSKINQKLELIRQLELKLAGLQSDKRGLQAEQNKLKAKIDEELKKIAEGASSDCVFCHQKVSADHIYKHLEVYENESNEITAKINELANPMLKIEEAIQVKAQLQDSLKNIDAQEKAQYERKYKIDRLEQQISMYQRENQNLDKQIQENPVNPFLGQIEQMKNQVNPHIGQVESIKSRVNHYVSELERHKNATNPHQKMIDELFIKVEDLQNKLSAAEEQCKQVEKTLNFGIWWKQAIHVYIKSYLMDSCLETLNTIADEYLNVLFDGVLKFNISATTEKGSEVKEKINVSIINNGDECSYQSLSGGERCRICLAVNLALAEVISKSSGKAFNMIFLDEILNGLDEAGKSQSMRLLKDLEKKYETIFVIDHAEGFKNLFSNSVMVRKKDKVSSIV